jgi:hypothetical protein
LGFVVVVVLRQGLRPRVVWPKFEILLLQPSLVLGITAMHNHTQLRFGVLMFLVELVLNGSSG